VKRLELATPRLRLVACDVELIVAEIEDRGRFSELIGAEVPADWPPPLNDENTREWTRAYHVASPDAGGWTTWYFLLPRPGTRPLLIGNGGFKGKRVAKGTCEIGYSIMESHQGRGYATEAVRALVEWAFTDPEVTRVVAHTLPDLTASIRVLERNGFTRAKETLEAGAIMFELKRPLATEIRHVSGA
jgi:RimJ/RimL family protein N-acetyltransferase